MKLDEAERLDEAGRLEEAVRLEEEMLELQRRLAVIRQKHDQHLKAHDGLSQYAGSSQELCSTEPDDHTGQNSTGHPPDVHERPEIEACVSTGLIDSTPEQDTLMDASMGHEADAQPTLHAVTPALLGGTASCEMEARKAALLEAKAKAEEAMRAEAARLAELDELLRAATLEFGEAAEQEKTENGEAEQDKAEQEKADKKKAAQDKVEKEQAAKEKADQMQAEKEKAEQEKAEHERAEKEKAEQERAEKEQADQKAAQMQAEKERAEQDKAEQERAEKEQADQKKAEQEREEREKADKEQAEAAQAKDVKRPANHSGHDADDGFAALLAGAGDFDMEREPLGESSPKKQLTDARWKALQELKLAQADIENRIKMLLDPPDLQASLMQDTFPGQGEKDAETENMRPAAVLVQGVVDPGVQARVAGMLRRSSTGNLEQLLAQSVRTELPGPDDDPEEEGRKIAHASYMRFWRSVWTNKKNPAPEEVKQKALQVKQGRRLIYCLLFTFTRCLHRCMRLCLPVNACL